MGKKEIEQKRSYVGQRQIQGKATGQRVRIHQVRRRREPGPSAERVQGRTAEAQRGRIRARAQEASGAGATWVKVQAKAQVAPRESSCAVDREATQS